ncbi:MAG: rRNA maturation RNase YbeY [Armatimonadota bacterium]
MFLAISGLSRPRVKRRRLKALTKLLLQSEGRPAGTQVSLLLCGDDLIRELNSTYRGEDSPTDVLSFPQNDPILLGDVIISLDTAARQAREFGCDLQDEVERLLIHGLLHLLGYDHQTDEDAAVMRAREEAILNQTETL